MRLRFQPTIRTRLLFIYTLVILVGLGVLFLVTGKQLNDATLEFYQHDLETEAFIIASGLSEPMEYYLEGETSNPQLQNFLLRQRTNDTHQLTLVDASGRVLASTENTTLFEKLTSPEIVSALDKQVSHNIRDDSDGVSRTYVAVPVVYEDHLLGAVRISAPMEGAYDEARERWYSLAVAALPVILITIGVSLWLAQSISRPVKQLQDSALQIASGALDERVTVTTSDEIGQLAQAFNFMTEQLNRLINAQRAFVNNAAHELRTPLMSLKLRSQALLEEDLPDSTRQQYVQEISDEVEWLSELVTSLLTLARLDEGHHRKPIEAFDVVAFFNDMAYQAEKKALAAGLTFQADIPKTLPEVAIATGDLKIVVDNLLGNALKYTPEGGRVHLQVNTQDSILKVCVRDTGEGFDPKDAERLFERFYRNNMTRSHQIPGTGLGLSIIRSILELYGGSIQAHSKGINQGAIFELTLPLQTIKEDG